MIILVWLDLKKRNLFISYFSPRLMTCRYTALRSKILYEISVIKMIKPAFAGFIISNESKVYFQAHLFLLLRQY